MKKKDHPKKRHVCFNPLCPCLNEKWNPTFRKEVFQEKQFCLKNGRIYRKKKMLSNEPQKQNQTTNKDIHSGAIRRPRP